MAGNGPASRQGLIRIADALRDSLAAEHVCFTYAEDRDIVTCGDSRGGDDAGTGNTGLWLVQAEAQKRGGSVAFDIRDRLVQSFERVEHAGGRNYFAVRIPIRESPTEMVVVRGTWPDGIDPALVAFLNAARPALIVFLERMLNASRSEHLRGQMSALANAAEVLTQDEDKVPVLEHLADAISNTTGYELITIDLWDKASEKIVTRALNRHRWNDTTLGHTWTDHTGLDLDSNALRCIQERQPILMPDIQHDPLSSAEARHFYKWIMLASAARVPIIFRDDVLGSVSFASWKPRSFEPEEMQTLTTIASQLAIGLKAMQMYKSLVESKEQLQKYSQQLEANTRIEHRLARTDALTGIPNRRYVEEVIDAEHARALRHGGALSVGLLDVDKLKAVNDEFGHSAGDELLVQLAHLARRSCRKGDVVGRYGGDEFIFVLPESDLRAARKFGERFVTRVGRQAFRLSRGDTLSLNVSLGIAEADATFSQHAPDV
ncbi:MAG: diguanylate cyclase, partial [Thermoanaerobaculia bacterium]